MLWGIFILSVSALSRSLQKSKNFVNILGIQSLSSWERRDVQCLFPPKKKQIAVGRRARGRPWLFVLSPPCERTQPGLVSSGSRQGESHQSYTRRIHKHASSLYIPVSLFLSLNMSICLSTFFIYLALCMRVCVRVYNKGQGLWTTCSLCRGKTV